MSEKIVSYAQNREDVILSAFFLDQDKGFYVDVGANDPQEDSVTKYFYDRGWSGINVEPSPRLFARIAEQRPRDINLNIGISDKSGMLQFREYAGHGLSTFSEETKAELEASKNPLTEKYRDYQVEVKRLDAVFAELGNNLPTIDFMKIDVEGYEYEVITSNDWTKYRPRVLCIEANHVHKKWSTKLTSVQYKKVFNDGLNDYYVDTTRSDIKFEYIRGLIGRDIIYPNAKGYIDILQQENRRLSNDVRMLRQVERDKDAEIQRLHNFIFERSRLKSLVRQLVRKVDSIILDRLTVKYVRRPYPVIPIAKINTAEPQAILEALKQTDKRAFLQKPGPLLRLKAATLTSLYWLYFHLRRLTFRTLRLIRKKLVRG